MLRDHRDHFPRELDVFRLLRIDAQPGKVLYSIPAGALGLERDQLLKIVPKPIDTPPVIPRPKRRFAYRNAAHLRDQLVIVCRSRHHVYMWIDVVHAQFAILVSRAGCQVLSPTYSATP